MLVYWPPFGVPAFLQQAEAAFQEPSKLLLSQQCLGDHSESCSFGGLYKLNCSLFTGPEGRQLCGDAWVAVRSPEEASDWREKGVTGRRGLVQQAGELQIPPEQRRWAHCPQAIAGCVTARECSGKATHSSSPTHQPAAPRKSHQTFHSCSFIYVMEEHLLCITQLKCLARGATRFIRRVPQEVCFCLSALGLSLNGNTLNHILQSAPSQFLIWVEHK